MIGLAVITGVALYIGIFWLIVRALKQRWAKALAVLVAFAIPFWDLPIGFYRYEELCKTEGGLRIFHTIAPQKSVCLDKSIGFPPYAVIRLGFDTVEMRDNMEFVRYGPASTLKGQRISSNELHSQYCVFVNQNQSLPWNTWRDDLIISDVRTGMVVGKYSAFHWLQTWWRSKVLAFPGGGQACFQLRPDEALVVVRNGHK